MLDNNTNLTENTPVDDLDGEFDVEDTSIRSFLTFMSNGLTYGVDNSYVVEIVNDYSLRPLPMVPDYIRGIFNLRGEVIPVIDLRMRLGCYDNVSSDCTLILKNDHTTIGLIVDQVSQVLDINLRKTVPIPVENKQELTNRMISLADGTVILVLNFEALVA